MNDPIARSRLLVVEDDADNLEALSVFLGQRYDVFGYQSPTDALEAIAAVKPDLLLLDIATAPIDGVDCLQRIRAIPGYVRVAAVAFTGFSGDVERRAFLTAGFDAVVVKPVADPQALVAVIEEVLASRREPSLPSYDGAALDVGTRPSNGRSADAHLDGAPTLSASFGGGLRESEGPEWPRSGDEDAG